MQVLYLIDISNDEYKRDRTVLFGSSCRLFLFADVLEHELAFYLKIFDDVFLVDVTGEISVEELSAQDDLRKLHLIYFKNFVKGLREALDDIILKTVDSVLFYVLLLFVEVDDVLHSVRQVRQDGKRALAEEELLLVV